MMNTSIQNVKEMNRIYLVLQGEENCTEPDFQMRMAAEADIPAFVKVQIRQTDCHLAYYYDISGKVSLEEWLQHRLIQCKELQALFQALFQAYEAVETYLLDANRILLYPSCIIVNGEGMEPQFCYGMEEKASFAESMQELMQYLLTKLNHSDEETVRVGYTLYQYCRKEQCALGEMLQVFASSKGQRSWNEGGSEQRSIEGTENQGELFSDTVWDCGLPAVVSEEAEERLLSVDQTAGRQSVDRIWEYENATKHISGLQWLILSVLSGGLALFGGIYCLIDQVVSGQGGRGLLLLGIVLLVAVCIWGMYWFYRENSASNMKKQ